MRDRRAIAAKTLIKQVRNKLAIEAAILNCVLDSDRTLSRRGPLGVSHHGRARTQDWSFSSETHNFKEIIIFSSFGLFNNPIDINKLAGLVAPYYAIPRNYLSDTPLLRAMGFLVSQHGQLGAIPPPPFLSFSPLNSMQSGGAIPLPKKGYLSDTCAIPYENKANGCDTPLCNTIRQRFCAIWGGYLALGR